MTSAKNSKHIGSDFDDFLKEDCILEEAEAYAIKRVLAWQFEEIMEKEGVNKV